MKTRRKRKKLLKPRGSCRYKGCLSLATHEPDTRGVCTRCAKHEGREQLFINPKKIDNPPQSSTIEVDDNGDGDTHMNQLTFPGKLAITAGLLFFIVLIGITAYQAETINKLEKAQPVVVMRTVVITPTLEPTATPSAGKGFIYKAAIGTGISATRGVTR